MPQSGNGMAEPPYECHLTNVLANAVALSLGEGGGDRQEQLAESVAGDVATEIEQVELDAPLLQAFDLP
jgi:hypothetical protein